MSDVFLVKSLLKQAGVTVLAGLLLSSAALAEDNADPAGGVGEEPTIDVVAVDGTTDPAVDDGIMVTLEAPVDENEVVDPYCAECSGVPEVMIDPIETVGVPVEGEETAVDPADDGAVDDGNTDVPEVTIDPSETDGEVVDVPPEVMYNMAPGGRPEMPEARGDFGQPTTAANHEARGDHGDGARPVGNGQTPGWLKKLFKSN